MQNNDTKPKIKIIVIRLHSKVLIDVVKKLQDRSVDVLYWEGSKGHFENVSQDKKHFPHTIFHDTHDAIRGVSASGVPVDSFEPVSKEMIASLLQCESRVLTMMNGIDVSGVPLSKRKRVYHLYLKYWHGVLLRLKPDAVIFGDIPHLAFHYVIYCIAKKLGIKTILYKTTAIPGRLSFLDDITMYKNIEESIDYLSSTTTDLSDLSPDIHSYYKKQTDPFADKTLFYVRKENLKERSLGLYPVPRFGSIIKNIKEGTAGKTALLYISMFFRKRRIGDIEGFHHPGYVFKWKEWQWNRIRRNFRREYERLQSPVDYSKKFIYVALQNQPECSTSAMGDIFVDQILMIDMLRASLPTDWVIYVKESPLQWTGPRTQLGRHKGYYTEIADMRNVFLVPIKTSTFELTKNAQTVVSVTGTAPWEAVLRGKPGLVFGHVWFMYCDGIFRVDSLSSCQKAIEKIRSGYKPTEQNIINFLAAVDRATVRGFPNKKFKEGYNIAITDEENTKNIADGFYDELMNSA